MYVQDQMYEIGQGMGQDIELVSHQLQRGLQTVLGLAALAFDDDGSVDFVEAAHLNWVTPFMWPHVKKHLKRGIESAALSPTQRQQWAVAVEGVYRVAGVESIAATEEFMF